MDHFGLSSVKDLPKLKDIQSTDSNEIGVPSELSDDSESLFSDSGERFETQSTDEINSEPEQ